VAFSPTATWAGLWLGGWAGRVLLAVWGGDEGRLDLCVCLYVCLLFMKNGSIRFSAALPRAASPSFSG